MSLTWDTMGFLLVSLSTTMSGNSASGQNPTNPQAHMLVQEVGHKRISQWAFPLSQGQQMAKGTTL